jgi:AcrR family transcriptional regulator
MRPLYQRDILAQLLTNSSEYETCQNETNAMPVSQVQKKRERHRVVSKEYSDVGLREHSRRRARERLISAAIRSFAERGYRGTSIDRIVELAGTTVPTFYRYFSNKRDLLKPLTDILIEEVGKVFRHLDGDVPPTAQRVREWAWKHLRMWRRLENLCAAHWEAAAVDPEFSAEIMSNTLQVVDSLTRLLAQAAPHLRDKLRLRLALLLVLVDLTVHIAGRETDAARAAAMIDDFSEVSWLALFSKEALAQFQIKPPKK